MKFNKAIAATAVAIALLSGCNQDTTTNNYQTDTSAKAQPTNVRIGTYNLSFDRATYADLVAEMTLTPAKQQALMDQWFAGTLSAADKAVAEKVIQIKNVATAIQTERPAILLMEEFNNDGSGDDITALQGFRLNYLAVPQNGLGATASEKKMLKPINFGYFDNFATNTGKLSGFDLDHNGKIAAPGDAWGFGMYHGQYAFSLLSQYPIDKAHIRSFQNFKWKDMPNATNPKIVTCDSDKYKIPTGMKCGDEWYSKEAWAQKPLSSKNHVDVPVLIPTADGQKTIHMLLSHPTPPIFDTLTMNNKLLNRAEINFWNDYISGNGSYIYDDAGVKGGIENGASFVIMGDLNADPVKGDGYHDAIHNLMHNEFVNELATDGVYAPRSDGGPECFTTGECRASNWDTPNPSIITSVSGLQLDHVIPSADLDVVNSGVFWPASFEDNHLLMNDKRVGKYGNSKDLTSDHRMTWIEVAL